MLILKFFKSNYYNLLFSLAIVLGIITGSQEIQDSNIQNFLFFIIATFVVYTIAIILLCVEKEIFSYRGLKIHSNSIEIKRLLIDVLFIPLNTIGASILYVMSDDKFSNKIILTILFILIFTLLAFLKTEFEKNLENIRIENLNFIIDLFKLLTVLTLSGSIYSIFNNSILTALLILIIFFSGHILIFSRKFKIETSELFNMFFASFVCSFLFFISQINTDNKKSIFIVSIYFTIVFYISTVVLQKYKLKILSRESTLAYTSMVLFLTAIISTN
jgi:hypothetical protein